MECEHAHTWYCKATHVTIVIHYMEILTYALVYAPCKNHCVFTFGGRYTRIIDTL